MNPKNKCYIEVLVYIIELVKKLSLFSTSDWTTCVHMCKKIDIETPLIDSIITCSISRAVDRPAQ